MAFPVGNGTDHMISLARRPGSKWVLSTTWTVQVHSFAKCSVSERMDQYVDHSEPLEFRRLALILDGLRTFEVENKGGPPR